MFDVNFAEGLWAEFREYGVDVCCPVLGSVYTPGHQRAGITYDPERDLLPDEAAREIIENTTSGPVHFVGDTVRASAARMWPAGRTAAVEAMSASTRAFAGRPQ
jgi:uncharacterized protein